MQKGKGIRITWNYAKKFNDKMIIMIYNMK
jgi:hypothetical protein